jgi:hypothetical protein
MHSTAQVVEQQPGAIAMVSRPTGGDRHRHHRELRDDDACRQPAGSITTADRRHALAKLRQHRSVAKVEQQQRKAESEQPAVCQYTQQGCVRVIRCMTAQASVRDRARWDRQQRQQAADCHAGKHPEC